MHVFLERNVCCRGAATVGAIALCRTRRTLLSYSRLRWRGIVHLLNIGSRAGALLAMGVLNCGVQHENDPAYAVLHEYVGKPDSTVRIGAIMGLGLAYAGTPPAPCIAD